MLLSSLGSGQSAGACVISSTLATELGSRRRYCRHFYFDAEPCEAGFAVVFRGADKARVGHGKGSEPPAMFWNDDMGRHRRFVLATSDDQEQAECIAVELRAFYAGGRRFTYRADGAKVIATGESPEVRMARLSSDANAIVQLLAPVVGVDLPSGFGRVDRYSSIADAEERAFDRIVAEARQIAQDAGQDRPAASPVERLKALLVESLATGECGLPIDQLERLQDVSELAELAGRVLEMTFKPAPGSSWTSIDENAASEGLHLQSVGAVHVHVTSGGATSIEVTEANKQARDGYRNDHQARGAAVDAILRGERSASRPYFDTREDRKRQQHDRHQRRVAAARALIAAGRIAV
jgi:hypothetical protein